MSIRALEDLRKDLEFFHSLLASADVLVGSAPKDGRGKVQKVQLRKRLLAAMQDGGGEIVRGS